MKARSRTRVCLLTTAMLIFLLASLSVACGKYGPPTRVRARTEPVQTTQPVESSEDDDELKEKRR